MQKFGPQNQKIPMHFINSAGFSLGLNDRAQRPVDRFIQRPVVFPQRPVVFSAPCHFPRSLWFLWAFISVILSLKLQKASN